MTEDKINFILMCKLILVVDDVLDETYKWIAMDQNGCLLGYLIKPTRFDAQDNVVKKGSIDSHMWYCGDIFEEHRQDPPEGLERHSDILYVFDYNNTSLDWTETCMKIKDVLDYE